MNYSTKSSFKNFRTTLDMFCKQEKQHVGTTMQKNIGLTTSNIT